MFIFMAINWLKRVPIIIWEDVCLSAVFWIERQTELQELAEVYLYLCTYALPRALLHFLIRLFYSIFHATFSVLFMFGGVVFTLQTESHYIFVLFSINSILLFAKSLWDFYSFFVFWDVFLQIVKRNLVSNFYLIQLIFSCVLFEILRIFISILGSFFRNVFQLQRFRPLK